jgi:hypothetical protein
MPTLYPRIMTSFARYYEDKKLKNYSMDDIELLISNECNKEKIAEIIFRRYYERYLKIFFYKADKTAKYLNQAGEEFPYEKNVYDTEYKNGFVIMASCCLLIETLSAFIEGDNETPRGAGNKPFESVFEKAAEYKNSLQEFKKQNFYKAVRCGILHQGETYKSFKIRRTGKLYDKTESAINATLFASALKSFLKHFADELKSSKWDGALWDNCRTKLRHIINNSRT